MYRNNRFDSRDHIMCGPQTFIEILQRDCLYIVFIARVMIIFRGEGGYSPKF